MKIQLGVKLQDRWKLVAKLCTGKYSKIYLACCEEGEQFAVKVDEALWITDEKKVYDILNSGSSSALPPRGITRVIGHGYEEDHGFLVFPRLGVSIHQLWVMCQRRFTHPTIAKIAIQAIRRLEFVHSRGIVHGDLVTKNFVMGSYGEESTIYLVDFGNARKFTDEVSNGTFTPNDPFLEGSSPRDDLMALARMLIRLHRNGCHKWLKENEPVAEKRGLWKYLACLGDAPPPSRSATVRHYWEYMRYVDRLQADHMPDYRFLVSVFKKFLDGIGEKDDNKFQWMDLKVYKTSLKI